MTDSFRKVQIRLALVIGGALLVLVFLLSGIILMHSERTTKESFMELVAADDRQIRINVDNYLATVEKSASLLFSDKAYYGADLSDQSLSGYARIQASDKIVQKIVDIGLLQNYSDFCVVYRDDSEVGWMSQTTSGMFPDGSGIYDTFSDCVTNEKTEDGWTFGVKGNLDRLWYVKRLNKNAVLVVSFYTGELKRIFTLPEQLSDMQIRLTDGKGTVLYSEEESDIGQKLPQKVMALLAGLADTVNLDSNMIGATSTCLNGWHLVCTMPLTQINEQGRRTRNTMVAFALVVISIFFILFIFLFRRINRPVDTMMENLNRKAQTDQLTGLLNKVTYESMVSQKISKGNGKGFIVYVIMDIDNFKKVNDTLGHEKGDEIIRILGRVLHEYVDHTAIAGRVGGDEFSVFMQHDNRDPEYMRKMVSSRITEIQEEFTKQAGQASGQTKMAFSISAGAVIRKAAPGTEFHDLYETADYALYRVKKNGKGRHFIEMMTGREEG